VNIKLPDISQHGVGLEQSFGTLLRDLVPARIGNPTTFDTAITGTDRPGLYWIHGLGADVQSAYPAVNNLPFAREYFIYGLPVLVKKEINGYIVKELDFERFPQFFSGVTGVHDQIPVYISQLMYGTLQPDPGGFSMQALVIGAIYGRYRAKDVLSADFSASPLDTGGATINVPTSNNRALGVLVQQQASTGNLSYKQGAQFNAALTHAQAFDNGFYPVADSSRQRIGWIRLAAGMTRITHDHIYNAPQIYEGGSGNGDKFTLWYFFR